MLRKYKHPQLGHFERLDIRKGGIAFVLLSEKELGELADYLNGEDVRGSKRILEILDAMQKLETAETPVFDEQIDGPFVVLRAGKPQVNPILKKIAPEKYRVQLEIDRLQDSINKQLARYRFWPRVSTPHERRWTVTWSPVRPGTSYEMGEAQALEVILNLARAGYLNRLRRCTRCKRWLYAKFRHQTFCSFKCQQKQYTQTEEFKAKRRGYMRRYYQQNFAQKSSRRVRKVSKTERAGRL